MKCKSCGSELREDARFCENCGAPVEVEQPAPEPQLERVDAEIVGDANGGGAAGGTSKPEGSTDYSGTPTMKTVYENSPIANDPNAGPIALSIASLVCGILSILCCCCSWFGVICAVAAIVLGIIAINKNSEGKGMAIAGIVCGGIGFLIGGAFGIIAATSSGISNMFKGSFDLHDIEDFIDGL